MQSQQQSGVASEGAQSFYIFDASRILPGDILLTRSQLGFNKSTVIQIGTLSRFSHAAICVEHAMFLEALEHGVRRRHAGRMAIRDLRNIRIMRVNRNAVANSARVRTAAATNAERYLARQYWLPGALAVYVKYLPPRERGQFFCSQLVAQAYAEAGLELLPRTTSEKVVPGAFLKSGYLVDVTDKVLRSQEHVSWMHWSFVEDEDESTPHDKEVKVIQAAHGQMCAVLAKYRYKQPKGFYDTLRQLATIQDRQVASKVDSEFLQILRSTGYLSLFDDQFMPAVRGSLELDTQLAREISAGRLSRKDIRSLLEMYRGWERRMPAQMQRRNFEGWVWRRLFADTGLATFQELAAMSGKVNAVLGQLVSVLSRAISILDRELANAV